MPEARTDEVATTPWRGGSRRPRAVLTHERPTELEGPGTLEPTDEGLRVVATWRPRSQRLATTLLGGLLGFVSLTVGLMAEGSNTRWVGVSLAAALTLGGVALGRWLFRDRAVDLRMPWSEVVRPGVSEDALSFEVRKPSAGTVRFAMPGRGSARAAGLREGPAGPPRAVPLVARQGNRSVTSTPAERSASTLLYRTRR